MIWCGNYNTMNIWIESSKISRKSSNWDISQRTRPECKKKGYIIAINQPRYHAMCFETRHLVHLLTKLREDTSCSIVFMFAIWALVPNILALVLHIREKLSTGSSISSSSMIGFGLLNVFSWGFARFVKREYNRIRQKLSSFLKLLRISLSAAK